jgi:hypothetical protein
MSEEKTYTAKDIEIERAHAQAFKSELEELRGKLKAAPDTSEVDKLRAELNAFKLKDTGADEKKVKQMIDEHVEAEKKRWEPLYTEQKTKAQELESRLKRETVTKVILTKAADVFHSDALGLLEQEITRECDYENDSIVVRGKDGKPRYSEKDPSKLMDQSEYLDGLVKRYPSLAKATAIEGGKNGDTKITAASNGKYNTIAELSKLPDKGRAYLNELAQTNPQAVAKILGN